MIVVLIPAHNEEDCIAETIESALDQERPADRIVVIPNGCTDLTAEIARQYPVTVMELPRLPHRKSQAVNMAWNEHAQDADIVVLLDADTTVPSHALRDWEQELAADPGLGGSAAKFTMRQGHYWARMQKFEYALNIDTALRRGWTDVLAGAGVALRNIALHEIASRDDREGPWSYESAVEDYELTYRLREAGWLTRVSPTVRADTDGMPSLRALRGQRMKWNAGTIEDLLRFGVNPLTRYMWLGHMIGALNIVAKTLLILMVTASVLMGVLEPSWFWAVGLPLFVVSFYTYAAWTRVPYRTWQDMALATAFFPIEVYQWIKTWWAIRVWASVLRVRITQRSIDRWEVQYAAEATSSGRR